MTMRFFIVSPVGNRTRAGIAAQLRSDEPHGDQIT
jgi:hypothetical protein